MAKETQCDIVNVWQQSREVSESEGGDNYDDLVSIAKKGRNQSTMKAIRKWDMKQITEHTFKLSSSSNRVGTAVTNKSNLSQFYNKDKPD